MQCCNKLQKQCKKKGGVSKCYKQYFWLSSVEQAYICFGEGKHSHVKVVCLFQAGLQIWK